MKERFRKGLRNPKKVPKHLCELANKQYHRYVQSRGASLWMEQGFEEISTTGDDAIRRSLFGEIEMSTQEQRDFRTYLRLSNFAHSFGCESILEIGAGLSTAIWAEHARRRGATVTSIDADFDRFERWITGTRHEQVIDNHVETREGMSITAADLSEFYANSRATFGGLSVARLAPELERFARGWGCPMDRIRVADSLAPRSDWSVRDIVVSDGHLHIPDALLNLYVKGFNTFESLLDAMADANTDGVLRALADDGRRWDMVWLDSGEPASMVEWLQVKDRVTPGGLAAFHDVFFPKSMKNFVVGASLLADPEWEVLFVDTSTSQGLLVARHLPSS